MALPSPPSAASCPAASWARYGPPPQHAPQPLRVHYCSTSTVPVELYTHARLPSLINHMAGLNTESATGRLLSWAVRCFSEFSSGRSSSAFSSLSAWFGAAPAGGTSFALKEIFARTLPLGSKSVPLPVALTAHASMCHGRSTRSQCAEHAQGSTQELAGWGGIWDSQAREEGWGRTLERHGRVRRKLEHVREW